MQVSLFRNTSSSTLGIAFLFFVLLNPSAIFADEFKQLSGAGKNVKVDQVSFTQTQRWGKDFEKFLRGRPKLLRQDWKETVAIPVPPANSSPRTKAEIDYLQSLVSKRAKRAAEIKAEVLVTNFRFGEHDYATLTTAGNFRETSKLILAAYHDLAIVTFALKKRFNRVRPSFLEKTLGHAIEIPAHPAYPSGHAIGAYTMAYLLQELDPTSAETYLKNAQRISENREIAGLHYPSDSEAGRLVARQLVDQLLSKASFQRQLQKAKSEWP